MKRHLWFVIVLALGLTGIAGCTHCGNHQALFPNAPWNKGCGCRTTPRPTTAPVGIGPGQPMPLGVESSVPPPGSALAPAPGAQPYYPTGPGTPIPSAPAPSAPAPSPLEIRGYGPAADSTWHAPTPNGGIQLAIPETAPPRESVRLNSPEAPVSPRQPAVSESRTAEPPTAPLPTEIRQFAAVYGRVASGLRPASLEGLNWLKANGYRAVLYLRRTNDDETSDRREIESRGLKYMSLEIQPQSLRENLDQFNFMVNDSANYPLFVYSRDPMISGSLWYLHFRTVDRLADDAARAKAITLGLQEEQTEANRPMWLAIQKALEQVR